MNTFETAAMEINTPQFKMQIEKKKERVREIDKEKDRQMKREREGNLDENQKCMGGKLEQQHKQN